MSESVLDSTKLIEMAARDLTATQQELAECETKRAELKEKILNLRDVGWHLATLARVPKPEWAQYKRRKHERTKPASRLQQRD